MRPPNLARCLLCLAWSTLALASADTSASARASSAELASESEPAALPTAAAPTSGLALASAGVVGPIPVSSGEADSVEQKGGEVERDGEGGERDGGGVGVEGEGGGVVEEGQEEGAVETEPVAAFSPVTCSSSTRSLEPTSLPAETALTATAEVNSTPTSIEPAPVPASTSSTSHIGSLSELLTSSSSSPPVPETSPSPTVLVPSSSAATETQTPATTAPTLAIEPVFERSPSAAPFLSFQEWRDRYIAVQDSPHARRPKKSRPDAVAPSEAPRASDGAGPAAEASGVPGSDAIPRAPQPAPAGGKRKPASGSKAVLEEERIVAEPAPSTSSSVLSPIQPLANAGLGGPLDPLTALKDRTNYAANTCNAIIHRASPKSKGAPSILNEKKDNYMLTPCESSPKFVELKLCDEVQIETVVLANFEFFSGTFKHFSLKCAGEADLPSRAWDDLGTFRARNVRGLQVFRPAAPSNFCRYVRIEFASHYGGEYFCPLSLVRVYGYTQWEAYKKEEMEKARVEAREALLLDSVEEEEEEDAGEGEVGEEVGAESTAEAVLVVKPDATKDDRDLSATQLSASTPAVAELPTSSTDATHTTAVAATTSTSALATTLDPPVSSSAEPSSSATESDAPLPTPTTLPSAPALTATPPDDTDVSTSALGVHNETSTAVDLTSTGQPSSPAAPDSAAASLSSNATTTSAISTASSTPIATSLTTSASAPAFTSSSAARTEATLLNPRPVPRNDTHSLPRAKPLPPPAPPPIVPGESIYGTIMKRLGSAERDQALAMHYIDAQSGMLRDAFERLEARLQGMEAAREAQQALVRQATMDLARTRLELSRERGELTAEVRGLGKEVLMEKRLSLAELVGLLLVVVFVGLTRGSPGVPLLGVVGGGSRRREQRRLEEKREREKGSNEVSSAEVDRRRALLSPRPPRDRDREGAPFPRATSTAAKRHSLQAAKPAASPLALRRHHYQPGTPSHAPGSAAGVGAGAGQFLRSPRPWTPPSRKGSGPLALGERERERESVGMSRRVSATRRKGASEGGGAEGDAHLSSIGLGLVSPERGGSPAFARVGSPSLGRGAKARGSLKVPPARVPLNRVSSAPSEFDTEASDAPGTSGSEDEGDGSGPGGARFGLNAFARESRGGAKAGGAPGGVGMGVGVGAGTDSAWTVSESEREEEWLAEEYVKGGRIGGREEDGGRWVRGVSPLEAGGEPPEEGLALGGGDGKGEAGGRLAGGEF